MPTIPDNILATVDGLSPADAAAALSTPALRARGGRVTFTTLASVWGFPRAVVFMGGLDAMSRATDPQAAAAAQLAIRVLGGDGFVPGDPQAAVAAELFVGAGLATADEVRDTQYDLVYPANEPVTADDVTAARDERARRAAISADVAAVMAWVNDVAMVSLADPQAAYTTPAQAFAGA